MGWEIVAANAEEGRIEATDTTLWFGFKDDVVVRIQARDDESLLDVRSVSRVGKSDVGTNAPTNQSLPAEVQWTWAVIKLNRQTSDERFGKAGS